MQFKLMDKVRVVEAGHKNYGKVFKVIKIKQEDNVKSPYFTCTTDKNTLYYPWQLEKVEEDE